MIVRVLGPSFPERVASPPWTLGPKSNVMSCPSTLPAKLVGEGTCVVPSGERAAATSDPLIEPSEALVQVK
jgi:hypothetical protein